MKVLPPAYGPLPIDIGKLMEKEVEALKTPKPTQPPEQETVHNESRGRSMQSDLSLSGKMQQAQLNSQVGLLSKGSSGPQVKDLQNQLNEWRASEGKPPIGADGIFGKETEAALKDFQKSVGLKQDGIAGPDVKRFLGASQQLSGDPNYQRLSTEGKRIAVGALGANPNDPTHAANIRDSVKDLREMERDPQFASLPSDTQEGLRFTMFQYTDRPVGRQFVSDLAKNSRFQDLNPDQQSKMLSTIISNSDNEIGERYPYYMNWILNTKTLEGPKDDQLTNAVLNTTDRVASDPGKLFELHEMLNDPKFAGASRDDQLAMLNGFRGNTGLVVPS